MTRPLDPTYLDAYSDFLTGEDGNYGAGSDPWSGDPKAVEPNDFFFTPGQPVAAQFLNYNQKVTNDLFEASRDYAKSIAKFQGQLLTANFFYSTSTGVLDTVYFIDYGPNSVWYIYGTEAGNDDYVYVSNDGGRHFVLTGLSIGGAVGVPTAFGVDKVTPNQYLVKSTATWYKNISGTYSSFAPTGIISTANPARIYNTLPYFSWVISYEGSFGGGYNPGLLYFSGVSATSTTAISCATVTTGDVVWQPIHDGTTVVLFIPVGTEYTNTVTYKRASGSTTLTDNTITLGSAKYIVACVYWAQAELFVIYASDSKVYTSATGATGDWSLAATISPTSGTGYTKMWDMGGFILLHDGTDFIGCSDSTGATWERYSSPKANGTKAVSATDGKQILRSSSALTTLEYSLIGA